MAEWSSRLQSYRFPLLFVACFAALQAVYNLAPEAFVQGWLVHQLTVVPGAALINWLAPAAEVSAEGSRLVSNMARINVLRGCEGTETLLMLVAAIIAAWQRLPWMAVGLVGSAAVVFVLNQARIVTLFFVAARQPEWFGLMHGFVAPLVVVGGAALFFLGWLQMAGRRAGTF